MNEFAPTKGTPEMAAQPVVITLPEAIGTIEADAKQQERLDEFTERLASGEFHREADGIIPAECVDERDGDPRFFPNAVGGTETLMVADDLTTKRFAADDDSTSGAMRNIAEFVVAQGHPVGDHDGDHAEGDRTDCGGLDKMHLAYAFIAEHGETLRELTSGLGVEVSDDVHDEIVAAAADRHEFSSPRAVLDELVSVGGQESVSHLRRDHRGVAAVLNMRHGTTLDRGALMEEFGEDYQSFNVDVWSFAEAAELTAATPEETYEKTIAATYFNLAVGHLLWGKSMRVVLLD